MYNGIGLPTPRGSGTNGYVQKNLAFISNFKEKPMYKTDDDLKRADAIHFKEPNKDILEHERKRKIEVKCYEMEQTMEDQGYTESEINQKVCAYRSKLLEELRLENISKEPLRVEPADSVHLETGRLVPKGTHETAAINILKNSVFKEALGIGPDFQEGNSMEYSNLRRQSEQETKRILEVQKELTTMDSSSDESEKCRENSKVRKQEAKKRKKREPSPSCSAKLSNDNSDSEDGRGEKDRRHRKKHRHSDKSHSKKRRHSCDGHRRHRH
ncbi:serine/arginine repetitive matrix protein 2 [Paragonimus westermani]|uniref:Serine/arginine repetitive matrix protein 2 n=1 Tax=Paragonimus westermani TaxID=34504 RepID=A0A5J4NN12_9TREM|nr:serine/arginine repetitive matrix protein 2 [Paragonimus westermani]